MRILLEDLRTALTQLAAGGEVALPAKTTSWQSWVRRLVAYASTDQVQSQRGFWTELVDRPGGRLPVDREAEPTADTVATERTVEAVLDDAETAELLAVPDALNCRIDEALLAALSRTLSRWTGADRHLVDVERHDLVRLFDEVDLSRTVGWISWTHPVALTGGREEGPEATVHTVKEAVRGVPVDGIGWQLLRADADPVPAAPVELAFAYVGAVDPDARGSAGTDRAPNGRRPYAIEVEASMAGGALVVRWRYSDSRHDHRTVREVADRYLHELRAIIAAARDPGGRSHTPSDFPLARVDQAQLDELLSRI
jgi:non-ribosomal peptide synthase protein (TIGR01720 family)